MVLFEGPQRGATNDEGLSMKRLSAAGNRIACLYGDQLFVIPLEAINSKLLTEPVHFVPEQDAKEMVLTADAPLTVATKAKGGKPPYTYEAANIAQGVSVDPGSGAMKIDPAPLMENAIKQIVNSVGQRNNRVDGPKNENYADLVAAVARPAREKFKAITGVEATGFPVVVPADLLVRDSEQQTAVLNRVVLFDVPFAPVVAARETQVAQERQRNEQSQQQREQAMRANQAASSRPSGGNTDALERRISELERRNAELEGQMKLLKDLFSQQQGRGN
jgi:hypothetical protein